MKDQSHDLRRVGRNGRDRRVLAGNRALLSELPGDNGGVVHQSPHRKDPKGTVQRSRTHANWRVKREGSKVIAIEPNRDFENVFEGGDDPFQAALEYAAAELKKGMADA